MNTSTTQKKRVLIVGAGASGMSAAYALSLHPAKFEVALYERSASPGGMATSVDIDASKYGASYINDGVQGASPVFHNTYAMFDRMGFGASEVGMQVSFGRDAEDFWSNVFPSEVVDKFQKDIKKFGRVLKVIKALEPVFAMISVSAMLKMFRFSDDFGERIVYPLVALFFGTGNQTPFISSAILERVFMDPNMRLFEYSPTSFLASIPEMRAFPRLSLLYETWQQKVEKTGNVIVQTRREVLRVKRDKKGVTVWSRATQGTDNDQQVVTGDSEEIEEKFDELILAVDADAALKILGKDASWKERRVLGNVKYYRLEYDPSLRSGTRDDDEEAQKSFEFAEKNFAPLYFIRSYPSDKKKVEMSFDLTNYQPQFKGVSPYGPGREPPSSDSAGSEDQDPPPLERHVFQTIFLDKEDSSHLWSKDEVKPGEVILEKWWKQQSHRWQHYAGTVPWMMFINGKNHTQFAGAWTILNMHEIAVVSGLAAAYRLGADYPFADNAQAKRLFTLCLAASHGMRMRAQDREGLFS
ncbi:hypothetical protein HWV62_33167 [Athelia sp. TMB]|nr:hypothetical protein HWV62_33167 [Athelia sp. TMB]